MKSFILFGLFFSACTHAAEDNLFKFSGLAVVGFTHSSEHQADFTLNPDQPNGVGFTRPTYWGNDSRLALQADARLSPTVTTLLQSTFEHRYDNSFKPHITAAQVIWQATPDLFFRLGRQPVLNHLVPDNKIAWVRSTTEIFHAGLVNMQDGLAMDWQYTHGDTTWHIQPFLVARPIPCQPI